jgi:hypothetical protein
MTQFRIYLGQIPVSSGLSATAAQTLPRLSQAVVATQTHTSTVAQTLPKLAQDAVASIPLNITGTAAQTLPSLDQAAVAVQSRTATIGQTLPRLAQAVVAVQSRTATISQALPRLAQSVTAAQSHTSTIAQTLPKLTQAAVADVGSGDVTGEIVQTLPSLTQSVTANQTSVSTVIDYGESRYILRRARKKKRIKKAIHAIVEKVEAPTQEDIERALADILISVDNVEKNTKYQESINALIRAEVERKQKEIEKAFRQRQEQAAWLAEFTAEQERLAAAEAEEMRLAAEFAELVAAANKEYKKQRNRKRALMIAAMLDAL